MSTYRQARQTWKALPADRRPFVELCFCWESRESKAVAVKLRRSLDSSAICVLCVVVATAGHGGFTRVYGVLVAPFR
jgi:hypothetical protein